MFNEQSSREPVSCYISLLFSVFQSRRAHGVELQGNIVIFDEAHNLVGCKSFSVAIWLSQYC